MSINQQGPIIEEPGFRLPRLTLGQWVYLLIAVPYLQLPLVVGRGPEPDLATIAMMVSFSSFFPLIAGYFMLRKLLADLPFLSGCSAPELGRNPRRFFVAMLGKPLAVIMLPLALMLLHALIRYTWNGMPGGFAIQDWRGLLGLPGPFLLFFFMMFRAVGIEPPSKSQFALGIFSIKAWFLFAMVFLFPIFLLLPGPVDGSKTLTGLKGEPVAHPTELLPEPWMSILFWSMLAISWILTLLAYREAAKRVKWPEDIIQQIGRSQADSA